MCYYLQEVRALVVEIEELRYQLAIQQNINREKTMKIDSIEGIIYTCFLFHSIY